MAFRQGVGSWEYFAGSLQVGVRIRVPRCRPRRFLGGRPFRTFGPERKLLLGVIRRAFFVRVSWKCAAFWCGCPVW